MSVKRNPLQISCLVGQVGVGLILATFMCSVGLSSGDPPPPRVSYIEGTAAYEPAGDVDWSEVVVNLPLLSGDRIYSHPDARVEVEIGREDFLRLSEQTDVSFARAVADEIELTLNLGSVILRVYDGNRYRINTPLAGVLIQKKGLYRLTVGDDGQLRLSVKKGRAEVTNGVQRQELQTGQELVVEGPQSSLSNVFALSVDDAFDLWSDRRDARQVASTSIIRVGGGYVHGVYDLDYYGHWDSVSGYGHVWFPSVYVGWVPYRTGRWVHYPYWGWTWVSYEPWGWLPYHYGNWVYYSPYSRWCWVPSVSFSLWSPSLVNFYFGGGYIGWAPRAYGHTTIVNDNSVTVINKNTTIINSGWTRRGPRDGLTVVRQEDFGRRGARHSVIQNPEATLVENLQPGLPDRLQNTSRRGRSNSVNATAVRSGGDLQVSGSRAASGRSADWATANRSNTVRGRNSGRGSDGGLSNRSENDPGSGWNARSPGEPTARSRGAASVQSARSGSGELSGADAARRSATPPSRSRARSDASPSPSSDSRSTWSQRPNYWSGGENSTAFRNTPRDRQQTRIITIPRRDQNQSSFSRSRNSGDSNRATDANRGSSWSRIWGSRSSIVNGPDRTGTAPSRSYGSPSRSGSRLDSRSGSNFNSRPSVTVTRPRSSGWNGSRSLSPRLSGSWSSPSSNRSMGSRSIPSVRSSPSRGSSPARSGSLSPRRGRP